MAVVTMPQAATLVESKSENSFMHDRVIPAVGIGLVALATVFSYRAAVVVSALVLIPLMFEWSRLAMSPVIKTNWLWLWKTPRVVELVLIAVWMPAFVGVARLGGSKIMVLIFGCSFIADVAGLYIGRGMKGRVFGSRPLSRFSPNKTREGELGGYIAALTVAAVTKATVGLPVAWGALIPIVLAITFIGIRCDIMESAFKRSVGAEDSGTFLRDHGGFLDRCDALLIVTPLYFVLVHQSWF
jgi:CDP-diglyceride synthetase